jgi:Flp pilus assembly protein TadD
MRRVRVLLLGVALSLAQAIGGCSGCSKGSPAPSPAAGASASATTRTTPASPLPLDEAPLDWTKPIPVTPEGGLAEAGYVGSEACKDCHKDLYASYARHSMARTGLRPLSALDPKWLARVFDAGATQPVAHERSGFSYRALRKGSDYFIEEFVLGEDGQRVHSWTERVTDAYSAGSYGMAFYFRQGGREYQFPIDYYPQVEKWGIDPGASQGNPRFTKPMRSFCISCHADYPRRRAGTDVVFFDPMGPGVGCERCHGPGARHVASLKAADIVDPAHLAPARQLDVCTQCHESSYSSLRADRDEFSYRPGDPLSDYRVNFVGDPAEPDRFILLAHPERMVASACWKKSGGKLTCTSCHDPHKSSFDQPAAWWDAKCNACHADHPCTEAPAARAAQGNHCVTCHMRRGTPTSPPLVTITDHWIQRRPPPVRPGAGENPSAAHLVAWPDLVGEPAHGDDLPALEAMAYAAAGHADEAEKRAMPLVGKDLHVPRLYEWLAGHYGQAGQLPSVARAYASLLRFEPNDAGALLGYARTMLDRGPAGFGEAMHALDRLLALDPDDPAALETKATFLFRSGHVDEARPLFAHAATVGPAAATAHVALALLAHKEGREADAIDELEKARRIEPGDEWILARLRETYAGKGDTQRAADIERAQAHFRAKGELARTPATLWIPSSPR